MTDDILVSRLYELLAENPRERARVWCYSRLRSVSSRKIALNRHPCAVLASTSRFLMSSLDFLYSQCLSSCQRCLLELLLHQSIIDSTVMNGGRPGVPRGVLLPGARRLE